MISLDMQIRIYLAVWTLMLSGGQLTPRDVLLRRLLP